MVRRSGRRADERVGTVMQALETRMDELAQELAGAVARAEEESRRSRFLGEIAGSIDLDEVLSRTLEAAGGLDGVDAAVVRVDAQEGAPIVAALGLSSEERGAAGDLRAARRAPGPLGRDDVPLPGGGRRRASSSCRGRPRRAARRRPAPARLPRRLHAEPGAPLRGRGRAPRSRRSRAGPGRRSRTPAASARRASSPTSTRSAGCTTAATSTRRSPATSRGPTATAAAWR